MSSNLILQILSTHQPQDKHVFENVESYNISPVATLNVPEISFTYKSVPCKARFENIISFQKYRLIKFLIRHDLRVWPVLMMLRFWRASFDSLVPRSPLREGEEFEDYILLTLLVFFLIKIKIVPPVTHLQSMSENPLIINDTDVSFCSDHIKVPPARISMLEDKSLRTLSILGLLQDFFVFFGTTMDFKENVVCSAIGELVSKRTFKPHLEKELPPSIIKKYRFTAKGDLRVQKLNVSSPMVLQDPLDLTDNVARLLSEQEVEQFQVQCREAAGTVQRFLDSGECNILKIFDKHVPVIHQKNTNLLN
jgi:hypothetical protein